MTDPIDILTRQVERERQLRVATSMRIRGTMEPEHIVNRPGTPSFSPGWSHSNEDLFPVRYFLDTSGVIHLAGVSQRTGTAITQMFLLFEAYRPLYQYQFVVPFGSATTVLSIFPSGAVTAEATTAGTISLDGVSYRRRPPGV